MPSSTDILIIGAGQAGGCAAASLRQAGFGGTITMIGDEIHRPYERPPLSKALLSGGQTDESIFLHKQELHDSLGLEWLSGTVTTAVDPASRIAVTASGAELKFDRCLIATGGRARLLPNLPPDSPNVHYLRGLDDARKLRAQIRPGSAVTVLGAGFLGLEFAGTARKMGMNVTVCEAGPCILGRTVPAFFANWLQTRFEAEGVRIVCNAQAVAIDASVSGVEIALSNGEMLESDLLLVAIGQQPNIELAAQAGLAIDNGIAVNSRCETSVAGIFSAGDCASHFNKFLGRRVRLESWQNAQEQAAVAARAMLDMPEEYHLIPWFWSDQLGMNLQMLGVPDTAFNYVTRGDADHGKFSIFGYAGQELRYVLAVNSGGEIRPLRNLLEAGKTIDGATLQDTSRSIRDLVKAALA